MPSPTSTGGDGIHFESKVAAFYLAQILSRSFVKGLKDAPALKLRLQRAFENQPLDDVIIHGKSASGEKLLPTQVKRSLTVGNNDLFKEVIQECWDTYVGSDFTPGEDRLGVAVGNTSNAVLNYIPQIVQWAQDSTDYEDFDNRIQAVGVASDTMRRLVKVFRDTLDIAAKRSVRDEELWGFLKNFRLLHFDFHHGDASDSLNVAYETLRPALHAFEASRVVDLWNELISIVDKAKSSAGSIDRPMLVERLYGRFRLAGQHYCKADIERISAVSHRALEGIRDSIGGVRLERQEQFVEVQQKISGSSFVEIIGEKGSGKSVLLKRFIESLPADSFAVVVDPQRLVGTPIEQQWGLDNALKDVLNDLASFTTPYLCIDGIDRVADYAIWGAINDVINAVRKSISGNRWKIVVTARGNNLEYIKNLSLTAVGKVKGQYSVKSLDKDSLAEVAAEHPKIKEFVSRTERARDLAKNPYLLDRLLRSPLLEQDLDAPITEIDLMLDMWISDGDAGPAMRMKRQKVLKTLALKRISTPDKPLTILDADDEEAIVSLSEDSVLEVDDITGEVGFVHDILEDWTFTQILALEKGDFKKWLRENDEPLWLVDAVQLLGQWEIEKNDTAVEWYTLLEAVSTDEVHSRWKRAILTSPLQSSGRALELLAKVERNLFQNDCALLKELMIALRTIEVYPNSIWYSVEEHPDIDDSIRQSLAYSTAIPRLLCWTPFMTWLHFRFDSLPPHMAWEVSSFLEAFGKAFRLIPKYLVDQVFDWCNELLPVIENGWGYRVEPGLKEQYEALKLGYRDDDKLKKRLRFLVYCCAYYAPEKVADFLSQEAAKERGSGFEHVLENSMQLAELVPQALVDFMLQTMTSDSHKAAAYEYEHGMSFGELGVEHDRHFSSASQLRPPFLYLLRTHAEEGLRLVRGLCNYSVDVWLQLQKLRGGKPYPVTVPFSWGESSFWGNGRHYQWFRGAWGPNSIMSALMALEMWMEEQIKAGVDASDLFKQVLENNTSVSVLGVCVSIVSQFPTETCEVAMPLAANPYVWGWDVHRLLFDQSPANTIGLPGDLVFRRAVAERNEMPHRKFDSRHLVLRYLTNEELHSEFSDLIKDVAKGRLPFEYEHERENEELRLKYLSRVDQMVAMSDPTNYGAEVVEHEGKEGVAIQYMPPEDLQPEIDATETKNTELNRRYRLLLWAEESHKNGGMTDKVAPLEALKEAKELYSDDVFDSYVGVDEFYDRQTLAAICCVASTLLEFHSELGEEDIEWCRDIVHRAAMIKAADDPLLVPSSHLSMHPITYGVRGLLGLLARNILTQDERTVLLLLTCHPLEQVVQELFVGIEPLWGNDPLLCRLIFALAVNISVRLKGTISSGHNLSYKQAESEFLQAKFEAAVDCLESEKDLALPSIPSPWVEDTSGEKPHPNMGNYRRADNQFMWHIPKYTVFSLGVDRFFNSACSREDAVALMAGYISWTIEDCLPPWKDRHDRRGHHYGWMMSLMEWCAKLTSHLQAQEVSEYILAPLSHAASKGELHLIANFVEYLIQHRVSQEFVPDENFLEVWKEATKIVYDSGHAERVGRNDYLDIEFGPCVYSTIFTIHGHCFLQHPWPALSSFEKEICTWVELFASNPACLAVLFNFLSNAGWPMVRSHALEWLNRIVTEKRREPNYWSKYSNGSTCAGIIDRFVTEEESSLRSDYERRNALVSILDVLVENGIRHANVVQQRIARLARIQ